EVKKYINQIALSGALEFIDKYESKENNSSGIIGHFGLGFYSVFMVSDTVEINTKTFADAPSVHWECDGNGQFSITDSPKNERGTDIVLHISDEEVGYLDGEKIREILEKYCAFMPYPVLLTFGDKKDEQINDTNPLWQRKPADVTDEEYKAFYKKVFGDYQDPLMYVHINADYPLNFKGILYFPKRRNEFDAMEPKVNLYYNSVFVADNIKEVIPEFLLNIRGVLDCPELPLNVSRSYLQTNTYVQKVSQHIAKKVADKINSSFANDRSAFEAVYPELSVYIEYGCMKEEKFYDRVKDSVIFKTTENKFVSLPEYLGEKAEGNVFYTNEEEAHSYYVSLYTEKSLQVLVLNKLIDTNFAQFLESKNSKVKFKRIDSNLSSIGNESGKNDDLSKIFEAASGKKAEDISFVSLKSEDA
ncbi:MAG: molecular chaperone HtpG, partial [Clostridia bacterium]